MLCALYISFSLCHSRGLCVLRAVWSAVRSVADALFFHSCTIEYDTKNASAYYLSFVLQNKSDTKCMHGYAWCAYLFDAFSLWMSRSISVQRMALVAQLTRFVQFHLYGCACAVK